MTTLSTKLGTAFANAVSTRNVVGGMSASGSTADAYVHSMIVTNTVSTPVQTTTAIKAASTLSPLDTALTNQNPSYVPVDPVSTALVSNSNVVVSNIGGGTGTVSLTSSSAAGDPINGTTLTVDGSTLLAKTVSQVNPNDPNNIAGNPAFKAYPVAIDGTAFNGIRAVTTRNRDDMNTTYKTEHVVSGGVSRYQITKTVGVTSTPVMYIG